MKRMKQVGTGLLLLLLVITLLAPPSTAYAQDDTMPIVFRDTMYGAVTGAFLGGLLLLTTNNKSDHWDYVAYGGLIGAVGGVTYGIYDTSRPLVEIEKDKVTVGLPTIRAGAGQGPHQSTDKSFIADLVRLRF
jgi:hypothetical protein